MLEYKKEGLLEIFTIIAGLCSILSFLVSIFIFNKVTKISHTFKVKGEGNITAGRDIKAQ